jgi:hypothetical protein
MNIMHGTDFLHLEIIETQNFKIENLKLNIKETHSNTNNMS